MHASHCVTRYSIIMSQFQPSLSFKSRTNNDDCAPEMSSPTSLQIDDPDENIGVLIYKKSRVARERAKAAATLISPTPPPHSTSVEASPAEKPRRLEKEHLAADLAKLSSPDNNATATATVVSSGPATYVSPSVNDYLWDWMLSPEHIMHPYPTQEEMYTIMRDTKIDEAQLKKWFRFMRQRFWGPKMEESMIKHGLRKIDAVTPEILNSQRANFLPATGKLLKKSKITNTQNTWYEMYKRLKRYHRLNGNCNVPREFKDDQALATWVCKQRQAAKDGRFGPLGEKKLQKLKSLGFKFHFEQSPRTEINQQLSAETSSSDVMICLPVTSTSPKEAEAEEEDGENNEGYSKNKEQGEQIFVWLCLPCASEFQRNSNNCLSRNKSRKLAKRIPSASQRDQSSKLYDRRVSIPKFTPPSNRFRQRDYESETIGQASTSKSDHVCDSSCEESCWHRMFGRLRAHHTPYYSHRHVSTRSAKLGNWLIKQGHLAKKGTLPNERIELLNSIGFSWHPTPKSAHVCDSSCSKRCWYQMFELLREYRNRYGNCHVIYGLPKLGKWTVWQRRLAKKGRLPNEMMELLNSIGFQWGIRGSKFDCIGNSIESSSLKQSNKQVELSQIEFEGKAVVEQNYVFLCLPCSIDFLCLPCASDIAVVLSSTTTAATTSAIPSCNDAYHYICKDAAESAASAAAAAVTASITKSEEPPSINSKGDLAVASAPSSTNTIASNNTNVSNNINITSNSTSNTANTPNNTITSTNTDSNKTPAKSRAHQLNKKWQQEFQRILANDSNKQAERNPTETEIKAVAKTPTGIHQCRTVRALARATSNSTEVLRRYSY